MNLHLVAPLKAVRNPLGTLGLIVGLASLAMVPAKASLSGYDAAITADAGGGLVPLAKLTTPAILTGANKIAFNFGAHSGDVTMEFVLEGNPNAGSGSAYLAVGANTSSNLRYEQYNNTGQLGFTQLGVLDYLFSPAVPSPNFPVHIAYVWQPSTLTMKLYLNGSLAGSVSGVSASFAMPTGAGWLGANANTTETMTGTIHRVTVYDDIISDAAIQRHADAFNDRPPAIVSFSANPAAIFTPASSTLSWSVQNFIGLRLDGADVSAQTSLVVSPAVTTTYTLIATNAAASSTGRVTVVVNPAPVIQSFQADRRHVASGAPVNLSWSSSYGSNFAIAPAPGNVTPQTANGAGSVTVNPIVPTTYTLTVSSAFGSASSNVSVEIVNPAAHLVISEFMADNEATLLDEDGDSSDWIEIHNPTGAAISLAGHFLTDEKNDPMKWAFPGINLAAGGNLIVWASGKNRINPAAALHANFQLDRDGGYLALIGPGPIVVHEFDPYPSQLDDTSYGLLGGDPSIVRFMGQPTPGVENIDSPPPPAPVRFSRDGGMFTDAFMLALTNATAGAQIRFTTNGSVPSATNGFVYSAPITINTTRRIRAVALANGRAGRLTRENFIKLGSSLTNYTSTLPMMVIENFAAGVIPQKGWSGTGAGIRQVPRQDAVWATFEREAGVSALTNAPDMWSTIGIRGRGAFSSSWLQKPYSVEAVDDSGDERKVSPLGLPSHADWVLYYPDQDSARDPSLLFNTFAYELYRNTGHENGVRFRWVEAFVNEDGGDLQLTDRRGVYALIEKVSRGKDRLDFTPLSTNGATGSWLLSLNRMDPEPDTGWPAENGTTQPQFFHTAGPNRILQSPPNGQVVGDDEPQQSNGYLNFDNPSGYEITPAQRTAIEGWFTQFENVLWNNTLWRDPTNGYRKYLDPVDFADYFIMNTLTHNGDGLLISMFPWKGDDGRLRMGPAWDYNWSPYYIGYPATTGDLYWRPTRLWYGRLFTDPDFAQLYIDRWWDHRRGAMSNAGMDAIIDGQMNEISPAKALLNGLPSTTDWTNRLATMKTWLKTRADWIDSNYLRPPFFNQNGGIAPEGFLLSILGTNGTIYFTVDGSDPRASGGALSVSAAAYQAPFAITSETLVQARLRNGTNWSGLTRAVFFPPQDYSRLALTEIMFNPPAQGVTVGEEFEFLELKNTGTNILQLGGFNFTAGITFTFTNRTRLLPGQFFVLARNAAAFTSKYPGVPVNGLYTGKLDNSGETLRLATPYGVTVMSVTYNDRAPWPVAPDGHGFSLVPSNAATLPNSDDGAAWRASSAVGGSPGADDPPSAIAPIVINEIRSRAETGPDFIELFNPAGGSVNIGGWLLSDAASTPHKFRIPIGTIIDGGGYLLLNEGQFNPSPGLLTSFSLNPLGGSVYLFSADANTNLTGYSHGFDFGASDNWATIGRYVTSTGEEHFPIELGESLGVANSGPRVGPVVITEIHYHPDGAGDEFVELQNIGGNLVQLFYQPNDTNTWRVDGLGFYFPTNSMLYTNQRALIVATNPAAFRAKHGVPADVAIFGPFPGSLQDSGERLQLQRPDYIGTNGVSYITVDAVRYNDRAPWPVAADGSGASLQRANPADYGDDPINWRAALPTPGAALMPGQPPLILSQPQNRVAARGTMANFSVTANGAEPLRFQWFFNNSVIAGATNSILALANVQTTNAGAYSAAVFNHHGSAVSDAALLTVYRPPTFLAQPTNNFVRPGSNAWFIATALGDTALSYQWFLNGSPVPGATKSSLVLTNVQFTNEGTYVLAVNDAYGQTFSDPANLVLLVNPFIVEHPVSQTIVTGATVVLSVTVTNTATLPVGFRLRRNGSTMPTTHPGAFQVLTQRTAYFTFSGTNTSPPWTTYAFIATNAALPSGFLSTSATLTYVTDTDGDGLPDAWETNYFGHATAADRLADSDADGALNWQEYISGTDPTNALSYLRIDSITAGPRATLSFIAAAARTYAVQYADTLSGPWRILDSVSARTTNRVATVVDPNYLTNRFYRLTTPQQP
jgi:CotH kinase protein/Lamin Tail Domain/Fn3 associated/Concanavalin A-like lectin/glucanases superfamily